MWKAVNVLLYDLFPHTVFYIFQSVNPSSLQHAPQYLPSEGVVEEFTIMDAVSVSSADGESFTLQEKVTFSWLFCDNSINLLTLLHSERPK